MGSFTQMGFRNSQPGENLFLAGDRNPSREMLDVLLKLGRDLSWTSRQPQMLGLDTRVAASPDIAKRFQWPRLEENRELECGLGWTSECLRAPATILGGQW